MKKKIATLFVFVFMCLCLFTGCNLWHSDNYANLSAIVATNGDVKITRERLISAYNSSGYYYDQYYGYTRKEAIEKTIESLINREYLLKYISDLAKTNPIYELNKAEKYTVIKDTWDYIDKSITNIVTQTRKELNLTKEDLSTESEHDHENENGDYKQKETFTKKFKAGDNGKVERIITPTEEFIPETLPDVVTDYKLNLNSSSNDYKRFVWNRYINTLRNSQRSYNYDDDRSDSSVFHVEVEKTYKTNLENAILKKFENLYTQNFGSDLDLESGKYVLNEKTLLDIITKYQTTYNSNKELYNLSKINSNVESEEEVQNTYYKLITTTSSRENYLYYGNPTTDETLITCLHVLVKVSDEQTSKITNYEEGYKYQIPYGDSTLADYLVEQEIAPTNTFAYERTYNDEGMAIEDKEHPISVTDLYNQILAEINSITAQRGTTDYVEQAVKIFDKYIYSHNQDTGIVNAKFDYIVGTKTSAMVASFTEVVRKLYNNGAIDTTYDIESQADYNSKVTLHFPNGVGFAGAISAPFLERASNYTGYHIVLYTGTLNNVDANTLTVNNVYATLSGVKTSYAYGQDMFEFIYEKVAKDTYNNYQTQLVESLLTSKTELNSSNYSDLLKA